MTATQPLQSPNALSSIPLKSNVTEITIEGSITAAERVYDPDGNSTLELLIEDMANQYSVSASYDHLNFRNVPTLCAPISGGLERHGDGWRTVADKPLQFVPVPSSLNCLAYSVVKAPKALQAIEAMLNLCPFEPLNQMIRAILCEPSTARTFFGHPASLEYHHAYPGGLAEHSVDVARMAFASCRLFPNHERWFATVCGLLHDIGKTQTIAANGQRTEKGFNVTHEQIAFELLAPHLAILEQEWPDAANAIRYVLGWMNDDSSRPKLPFAIAVKAADRLSAARDNREVTFKDAPDWQRFASYKGPGTRSQYWLPRSNH